MSRMNLDVFKVRRDNSKHRFYEVPDFENFEKLRNLRKIKKFSKVEKIWLERRKIDMWYEGALHESFVRKLG